MHLLIDPVGDSELPGQLYVKLMINGVDKLAGWISQSAIDDLTAIVEGQGGKVETRAFAPCANTKEWPDDDFEQAEPGKGEPC